MFKLVLIVLAFAFFLLDAFRVPAKVSWTPLAFACLTAALFLPLPA